MNHTNLRRQRMRLALPVLSVALSSAIAMPALAVDSPCLNPDGSPNATLSNTDKGAGNTGFTNTTCYTLASAFGYGNSSSGQSSSAFGVGNSTDGDPSRHGVRQCIDACVGQRAFRCR